MSALDTIKFFVLDSMGLATAGGANGTGSSRQAGSARRKPDPKPENDLGWRDAKEPPKQESFTDRLPWMEYLPDDQAMLLEDGESVGAAYEIIPAGSEGRDDSFKLSVLEQTLNLIAFTIPEKSKNPWVLQIYVNDEFDLAGDAKAVADYRHGPAAEGSQFSDHWCNDVMWRHYQRVCRTGGIFKDSMSEARWRGRVRKMRLVISRRCASENWRDGMSPLTDLEALCDKLELEMSNSGIRFRRYNGKDYYYWLLRWFNPAPQITGGSENDLVALAPYPGDDDLPFGRDFSEMLCLSPPRADADRGIIYFDDQPCKILTTLGLRKTPNVGHFTGEQRTGQRVYTLMDRMPQNSILSIAIVFEPEDDVKNHLEGILSAAIGDDVEASLAADQAEECKVRLGKGDKLYKTEIGVYVRGEDHKSLRKAMDTAASELVSGGISIVDGEEELLSIDRFIGMLPMAFDPTRIKANRRARYAFASHIACLTPTIGRGRGTGNRGINFFNRGAETLSVDPLNKEDRRANAHMLILGPTGAGKSATLVKLTCEMVAHWGARIFIIEAGNSFGLLGDYLKFHGQTVHQVSLKPGAGAALAPFADAIQLIEILDENERTGGVNEADAQSDDEKRDILGEMVVAAQLMITGGDEEEEAKFTRSDRLVVQEAILAAGRRAKDEGKDICLPQDIVDVMVEKSRDPNETEKRQERIRDMADCMKIFTSPGSLAEQLFNRRADNWPETDVTIVDLAMLARSEDYKAELAMSQISLLNHINNLVERDQHENRPTIVITDEGHLITTNPLLAGYVTKITKMWRKLGAWYWLATQNVKDFPDAASRMINMMEWWLCLSLDNNEVEQLQRFRQMNAETQALLLDAKKEPGKYVEGVILSKATTALFRNVPPPIALALAMTEQHEKNDRARMMEEKGLKTEVEAAMEIAKKIEASVKD